jgi:hypothetical protein
MTTTGPHGDRTSQVENEHPALRQRFVGTWKLVALRTRLGDSGAEEPYRSGPMGYITYTGHGYVQAIVTAWNEATLESTAYAGTWDVRGPEVIHHVRASVDPDWVGTDLVRVYHFNADELSLTVRYPNDRYVILVWQKTGNPIPA